MCLLRPVRLVQLPSTFIVFVFQTAYTPTVRSPFVARAAPPRAPLLDVSTPRALMKYIAGVLLSMSALLNCATRLLPPSPAFVDTGENSVADSGVFSLTSPSTV